jgi:cytosine/adenosine deaminase-related metal-dependent hydrolase
MSTLLVKNARVLATMDDERREIAGGGLHATDGFIDRVGPTEELPETADEVLDLTGHVVLPGLVNTHHHFYQTLTRAVPGAQDVGLFEWLTTLYPIWARLTPDDIFVSTQIALAELALSGCTTASDHLYLYPNGSKLDDQVAAASTIGLRINASRGSMSRGESQGGLPPDSVVETEDAILDDSIRVIDAFHDPAPGSMVHVAVSPCSPFSVTEDLMRQAAHLARDKGVRLHTHLAETIDEEDYTKEAHGVRPVEWMEQLEWAGPDVWFAHCVHVHKGEIARMAEDGTGVAHCPSSNMRLASGISPLTGFLKAGVPVGLGVDGSASNDGNHLLGEARQEMLLARLGASPSFHEGPLLSARKALDVATRGGARVLGRNDIGSLEPGRCADFTAISLDRIEYAGAHHDPVAAVLFAAPATVDHTYVQGRAVVSNRELVTADLPPIIERHNAAARRVVAGD